MRTKSHKNKMDVENSNQEYEVEEILSKKMVKGKPFYLVKWKGYSASENTWEPQENVRNLKRLIDKIETSTNSTKNGRSKLQKNSKKIKKEPVAENKPNGVKRRGRPPKNSKMIDQEQVEVEGEEEEKKSKVKSSQKSQKGGRASKVNNSDAEETQEIQTSKDSGNKDRPKGSFKHDQPKAITKYKLVGDKNRKPFLFFLVDWNPRDDGTKPKSTWENATNLKNHCPRLLAEYYEKYITFV